MEPYEKAQRMIESRLLKVALERSGAPEKSIVLIQCLIENGCPLEALVNGAMEYATRTHSEDRKALHELLKDMPFKVELEGEENE